MMTTSAETRSTPTEKSSELDDPFIAPPPPPRRRVGRWELLRALGLRGRRDDEDDVGSSTSRRARPGSRCRCDRCARASAGPTKVPRTRSSGCRAEGAADDPPQRGLDAPGRPEPRAVEAADLRRPERLVEDLEALGDHDDAVARRRVAFRVGGRDGERKSPATSGMPSITPPFGAKGPEGSVPVSDHVYVALPPVTPVAEQEANAHLRFGDARCARWRADALTTIPRAFVSSRWSAVTAARTVKL